MAKKEFDEYLDRALGNLETATNCISYSLHPKMNKNIIKKVYDIASQIEKLKEEKIEKPY